MQRGRERHKDSKAGRPIELELDQFVENTSSRKLPAEKRSPKKFLPCFSRNTSEKPRTIPITGSPNKEMRKFPKNIIRNQKYSLLTFIPLTLWEQFNYFINFYYLVISLSQLIPALKVGFLFTYIAPLILVVALSMMKEAYDDIKRMRRDKAVNSEKYEVLVPTGRITAPASDLVVGNFVRVKANQRIPADMILLRTTNDSGASFIRTDQLDGETDWKLRRAVNYTQELSNDEDLFRIHGEIFADKPITDIYKFVGNLIIHPGAGEEDYVEPLGLDQTLWSSTVLAADSVIGVVVYTGEETRSVINTRQPSNKKGRLDEEVNFITILLCVVQVAIAISLTVAGLFKGVWWLNFFRYIILIAGIIPISMRVNLDFAKLVYAYSIKKDPLIPNCVARNTSIPEECGRISYLLSDKTGTLTQNDMIFKKLHLGSYNFNSEAIGEIADALETHYGPHVELSRSSIINARARSQLSDQVYKMISAAALCHNVSITREEDPITGDIKTEYQAASPDEVALVKFSESVGLTLHDRSLHTITLMNPQEEEEVFEIIECFPFSSARKRMGIILKNQATGEIRFLMKGADVVMTRIVQESEWLEEECTNLAREGLRTLVFGHKILTEEELAVFQEKLQQAQSTIEDREGCVERVIDSLEANLELLGLTGVEDKLQVNVRQTLEVIRCAGIKIWMLTGDKRETATCIGISSKLIARNQIIYQMDCSTELEAMNDLNEFASLTDTVLIIDGDTLAFCLATKEMADLFFHSTKSAPAVVCCRCSPTQKAEVVELIRKNSSERVAAIGDGGNDVSMIQAAHIGIGIEGKEGRQAALAADYSIEQFSHIGQLFLWHGRNAYHRSALISQVIAYRGMAISFMQTLYCAVFYMAPVSLYTGMLVFGYSCWYTMFPVFALVSDRDITPEDSLLYPELYQETRKGHILSPKTFSLWGLASIVQAMILFYCAIFLISKPINYIDFESVTFTALIFVELLSFALVIKTWNILLLVSLVSTVALYPLLMIILTGYYHIQFIASWAFWWKALTLTFVAMTPVYLVKKVVDVVSPRTTSKIS